MLLCLFFLVCCGPSKQILNADKAVDYGDEAHWAALPGKQDPSDNSPDGLTEPTDLPIDVFFLYPTSFLAKRDRSLWNAAIDNQKVNKLTDQSSIKYQASIFNQVGNIYAPRYRQAHYYAYFSADRLQAKKAFDLAYNDIKTAFQYYLDHYNHGKPIIIAGHSQGTTHGMRLVKEFFDGTPLQHQLVVAYLPGIPIPQGYFKSIQPCTSSDELACVNSWRTYKYGYEPEFLVKEPPMIVVNPLTWDAAPALASKDLNRGAVLKKFKGGVLKGITDAQIHKNILWVHKPKFPGSFLYRSNNFHIADFNFFYLDIRENAIQRREEYLQQGKR